MPLRDDLDRHRAALEAIVNILGPYNEDPLRHRAECEGCAFEVEDAIIIALNTLSGLEPEVHYSDSSLSWGDIKEKWLEAGLNRHVILHLEEHADVR